MENIILVPVMHRKAEQILIQCVNLTVLNRVIRKLKGVKWSSTYKAWYLPLNQENYRAIVKTLHDIAVIHTEELKAYLLKKKLLQP